MLKVIVRNHYEEDWEYDKKHGNPYLEEPQFDRTRFGNNVVHKINSSKELYDLWIDAKKLNLSDSSYDWVWTEVSITPFEDYIMLEIYEEYSSN